MNTDIAAFQKYFASFKELYTNSVVLSQSNIDLETAAEYFYKFKIAYNNTRQQGYFCNIWELVKLERHELQNCSILAWLLDCHGSHGQGDFFCRAVLELINKANLLSSQYTTTTEDIYCSEENKNRVDIVLENNDFCVFIEAKIDATEQPNQRERYLAELKKKKYQETAFIYLTPYLIQRDDEIYYLTWHKIANAILTAMEKSSYQLPEYIKIIVQQYCCHIKKF